MPEGPLGAPRLTNIGPLSRATAEEIKQHWFECPDTGKESEICINIKKSALAILENQGLFTECQTLEEINQGNCGKVASRVAQQIDGVTVLEVGTGDHFWIEYNGKHYDAEVPTGVDTFRELPIFARISPNAILEFTAMQREKQGEKIPETIEDTIRDATEDMI